MGTCCQPGYVFPDFCINQGIDFINFCLKQPRYLFLDDKQPARMFYECLNQGIKNQNSVLNKVGKSGIFVLNGVRV